MKSPNSKVPYATLGLALCGAWVVAIGWACTPPGGEAATTTGSTSAEKHRAVDPNVAAATAAVLAGRETFRFDTFGDETFWGDTLKLHEAIEGSANGGVGGGVSPRNALAVGLKVDVEA